MSTCIAKSSSGPRLYIRYILTRPLCFSYEKKKKGEKGTLVVLSENHMWASRPLAAKATATATAASRIEAAAILSVLGYQTAYEQLSELQNRASYRRLARD
ncbi:unnamed protein product [Cercopithifilaria johnstoni]|uniref:Uncharacterized protein n=1 Tax=Cercopithifilaria johnstoni TaxID=2874296 RepID=A0A8J2PY95_9BILA|nr:unnamed protein product [Cercopithifilaria johnstoni]